MRSARAAEPLPVAQMADFRAKAAPLLAGLGTTASGQKAASLDGRRPQTYLTSFPSPAY
jgi:hypothetical protein